MNLILLFLIATLGFTTNQRPWFWVAWSLAVCALVVKEFLLAIKNDKEN
jgi:hypothetical protein